MEIFVKVVTYISGIFVPAIISYYIAVWLQSPVNLEYYKATDDNYGGDSLLDDKLKFSVTKISYMGTEYQTLRVIKFLIVNTNSQNLESGAHFFFLVGNELKPLNPEHVVDLSFKAFTPQKDPVIINRKDNKDWGTGFTFSSDLPGKSNTEITIVLNGKNKDLNNKEIVLKKTPRKKERLQLITSPGKATLSMKAMHFYIWLASVASLYSITWLLINIFTGNYSTGAQIVNWVSKKIFGIGFIK
ncbi:hypothetical protein [Desulfobacula phenolica]|uniref:Uncharacterized protein n=1 Tax=Desulfobacula phenolica TaxID=90732 RepID=A0A1H2KDF9_9BACT|nr:hypothetical protein [Desulfobacula phenolica]SDU66767.1 hypothetical protein SAMN04487931_1344 [Desulfobacula phenolica]